MNKELKKKRDNVQYTEHSASSTSGYYAPDTFPSLIDNNKDDWKNFRINILENNEEELIFEIIGIEAPIANAFRRILIAEVHTMAIERVIFYQNTSIIPDEVLANRLGLIPIRANPDLFDKKETDEQATDLNTLVFTLNVQCSLNPKFKLGAQDFDNIPDIKKYQNSRIYSGDLKWIPQGNQSEIFVNDPVRPVHDDILLAKLRPGQSIEAELRCEKGISSTHAKWSPVATAVYSMLPIIDISPKFDKKFATELVNKCPKKVFDIENDEIVVSHPSSCTMCRECIRDTPWAESINLQRCKHHFIFSVESTGCISSSQVFVSGVKILKRKCLVLLDCLKKNET